MDYKHDYFFPAIMTEGGMYFASFSPIGSSASECIPLLEAFVNLRGPYSERMNVHYE